MKKFFREHGIWVLFATAVIAVSLSLMSFFSNTSSPLSNLAGIIASPFRSAYTAVTGWITDKQNYYQDVTALEEETNDDRPHRPGGRVGSLLNQEMPFIPLWFSYALHVQSKTVTGIDYAAAACCNENVWQWEMTQA